MDTPSVGLADSLLLPSYLLAVVGRDRDLGRCRGGRVSREVKNNGFRRVEVALCLAFVGTEKRPHLLLCLVGDPSPTPSPQEVLRAEGVRQGSCG